VRSLTALVGQATMLSCWRALAGTAFGPGRVVDGPHASAAVFPTSAYFNNAVLVGGPESLAAAVEAVRALYAEAGVTSWALWVPNDVASFGEAADRVAAVPSLVRDETTLVMSLELDGRFERDPRVRPVSGAALARLVLDEDVPPGELGHSDGGDAIVGWALVDDGRVVTSAYTHRHGMDLGIYAVGTPAQWRRRGYAGALMRTVLADAWATGLGTASLQSTPMGEALYRSLGFRAAGRYEEWVSAPDAS